jgi:hypothetical protein
MQILTYQPLEERILLLINAINKFPLHGKDTIRSQFLYAIETIFNNKIELSLSQPNITFNKDSLIRSIEFETPVYEIQQEDLKEHYTKYFKEAIEFIKQNFYEYYNAYMTLINNIYILSCSDSSSSCSPRYIGYILLFPKPDWTIEKYAEAIIHETVHNMLFIYELVHRVFCADEHKFKITSSISNKSLCYYRSYHSMLVAIALIDYYLKLNNLSKANELWESSYNTLNDLESIR